MASVIVVNYNGREHLADCLSALCADRYPWPIEILLVDNASTDGSLAMAGTFAAQYDFVSVLCSPTNRGYMGGVNFALGHARGRYVAVLNMDLIVTAGWLEALIGFLQANPAAGAVSPLLLLAEMPGRINAIGQSIHVTGLGFNRGLDSPAAGLSPEPVPVSGIHGGAFVMPRTILDEMSGLDESGFLYHEDVELSWLLHMMGYDLYCVPTARVHHKYFLTMYPEKFYLLERNRLAMLAAYLAPSSVLLLAPLLACTEIMLWGYCLLRGATFLRAKLSSYRWVIGRRAHLRTRRAQVRALRRRPDRQVLSRLAWNYHWEQFITLGKERGASRRQPTGGMPAEIVESR